ncbi:TetR/AcrR family transcriptional regulator [Lewinella sp. LCG006]|uniref:TetR/AcrR family transcriptional regulator n=1 Tax=Lewinella sp. LCG006 TaxID=3231911 RepID=UPI003460CD4B
MSPRTTAQFDEIRQRSRQRIMAAALELFGTRGYASTSINQIAKAAEVSKGLMYNYFESKQDLLQQIVLTNMEEGEQWWQEILALDVSPFEKIEKVTKKSLQVVQEDEHHWRLLTSLMFQPHVLEGMEAIFEQKVTTLQPQATALFEALGVPFPEKEALLYSAALDGMFLQYLSLGAHYPIQEIADHLLDRYRKYHHQLPD